MTPLARRRAPMEASGKGAVDRAAQEGQMQSADQAPQAQSGGMVGQNGETTEQGAVIRVVGARTFVLQDQAWIDTTFDPKTMKAQQVVFLSDEYFRLAAARPDIKSALALGSQVTLVVDGKAYQVVAEGQNSGPVELPQKLPTTLQPSPTRPAIATPVLTQVLTQPSPAGTLSPTAASPVQPVSTGRQKMCLAGLAPLGLMLGIFLLMRLRKCARADADPQLPACRFRRGGFASLCEALDYAAHGETGLNFFDARGRLLERPSLSRAARTRRRPSRAA